MQIWFLRFFKKINFYNYSFKTLYIDETYDFELNFSQNISKLCIGQYL